MRVSLKRGRRSQELVGRQIPAVADKYTRSSQKVPKRTISIPTMLFERQYGDGAAWYSQVAHFREHAIVLGDVVAAQEPKDNEIDTVSKLVSLKRRHCTG